MILSPQIIDEQFSHNAFHCYFNFLQKRDLFFPLLNDPQFRFYPIVDSSNLVLRLAHLGVKYMQLRIKNISISKIQQEVRESLKISKDYSCRIFINDYWQIALEEKAFGVHLGFEDAQEAPLDLLAKSGIHLGLSTHSKFELLTALSFSPSYLALGPIFETLLKKMRFEVQGLTRIKEWQNLIHKISPYKKIPLVAIGGVTLEQAQVLYAEGADCLSVVSDIYKMNKIEERVCAWMLL